MKIIQKIQRIRKIKKIRNIQYIQKNSKNSKNSFELLWARFAIIDPLTAKTVRKFLLQG